jgi:hypothetical protein
MDINCMVRYYFFIRTLVVETAMKLYIYLSFNYFCYFYKKTKFSDW